MEAVGHRDVLDSDDSDNVDRRRFLASAGVAAAGVAALGVTGAMIAGERRADARSVQVASPDAPAVGLGMPVAGPDVRALFGDLAAGGRLGDWRISRVHGLYLGAIPVVMVDSAGTSFQVDVLRRDADGLQGVGNTDALSLFLANQGNGSRPTDENHGLGVMALAHQLSRRGPADVPGLLTFSQRREQHPNAVYAVRLQVRG